MAVGICHADYATPLYPQKLALSSPTSGGRSVGIVRSRIQPTEFYFVYFLKKRTYFDPDAVMCDVHPVFIQIYYTQSADYNTIL
jgi:hypothetical protein